jgi:HAD superfamily hydrolase (TIGR01490 family)
MIIDSKKKFAVFDIDGTIFHWQFFHELFDELVDARIISQDIARPILTNRDQWRRGIVDWNQYEASLVEVLNKAIVGIDKNSLEDISERIIKNKGRVLYHYTRDLLKTLQAQSYVTIVISGSQQPLVERLAKIYKIDIALGVDYEYSNNKLTSIKRPIYGQKDALLKALVVEHNLDWQDSYAVGDTYGDAAMLKLVDNPIAFNPDHKLLLTAKEKGWKIVVERKSIAYTMERNDDGLYILA